MSAAPSIAPLCTRARGGGRKATALLLAAALALCGCASLTGNAPRYDPAALSLQPTLLVATTRKPVHGGQAKPWFGTERASALTVARARLIPPGDGRFSLGALGLGEWRIDEITPVQRIAELVAPSFEPRDVLIYVHGFNQTFETAALDAARLSEGIRFQGESMVFSWPSKAKLFDYGYDRESAMWSRDALERVLTGLLSTRNVARIHIVAHSVGTMLTLEAMRQLYARRGMEVAERIGAVVFAAPDIDMDVFASSVERMPYVAPKITVITAANDRALAVAGWLAGMTRVGSAEKDQLEQLGLRVVDASSQGLGFINHDLFLANADIKKLIRRAIEGRPLDDPS